MCVCGGSGGQRLRACTASDKVLLVALFHGAWQGAVAAQSRVRRLAGLAALGLVGAVAALVPAHGEDQNHRQAHQHQRHGGHDSCGGGVTDDGGLVSTRTRGGSR